ncbi:MULTISPECIES: hypothetical protein [unclassified Thiocapsa]|uniref:hypothetical protein n=1 Tax=unclassified Thiocapsa TaxID=2641286 RepID=UPI0035B13737
MRKQSLLPLAGMLVGTLGLSGSPLAAVHCIDNAVDLQSALNSVGEDDEIRLVQGTYVGNFLLPFVAPDGYGIRLLGGWTAGCATRTLDPTNTILDGNGAGSILHSGPVFVDDVDLLVEGLTLRNGVATQSPFWGGGLAFWGNYSRVTLRDNRFEGNHADQGGGGVSIHTYGATSAIELTRNHFEANDSQFGGAVYGYAYDGGGTTWTDNRFVGNTAWHGGAVDAYLVPEQKSRFLFPNSGL